MRFVFYDVYMIEIENERINKTSLEKSPIPFFEHFIYIKIRL